MDVLLSLLEGKRPDRNQVLLRSELIVRNSVARPL
jgi:LacI family repressor for deo operon, udp, cdd, tsx, nupC, and nupG